MSVLSELESAIGVLPGNNVNLGQDYSKRTALRAWLVANGVDSKRVANMQDSTLVTAYKSPSYLDSVRSDKHGFSRKSRANGASFVNFNNESAETTSARNSTSAIFDEPQVSVPPPLPQSNGVLNQVASSSQLHSLIAKAADAVITPRMSEAKRGLEQALDEKLRNAKLELSPDAKLMLRQIAQDSAREAFESWLPPKRIEICDKFTNNVTDMGIQHEMFPTLLRACMACDASGNRLNIWLTGQPGSGKTHAAKMVAKALKLDFAGRQLSRRRLQNRGIQELPRRISEHRVPSGLHFRRRVHCRRNRQLESQCLSRSKLRHRQRLYQYPRRDEIPPS